MTRRDAEDWGLIPRFNPNDPASAPRAAVLDLAVISAKREAICRACEHLAGDIRCTNLNCGCPKSANRLEPWKNLPRCIHWNQASGIGHPAAHS